LLRGCNRDGKGRRDVEKDWWREGKKDKEGRERQRGRDGGGTENERETGDASDSGEEGRQQAAEGDGCIPRNKEKVT
jgi:hypothetical protein